MNRRSLTCSLLLVLVLSLSSSAQVMPPSPAQTNANPANNGMKHLNVALSATGLAVHTSDLPTAPLAMMSGFGKDYTADKFNVLEDVYFNAQYGWLPDGLFDAMPTDGAVWIKRLSATTPAGASFNVYEAGNMSDMASWTMNPIYVSDGDIWRWDGAMQHDYYTADVRGDYAMEFEVFVGDATGTPLTQFAPATARVQFSVVPEPASGAAFAFASAVVLGIRLRRSPGTLHRPMRVCRAE